MPNLKYIKNPGYIYDLMFVFILQFNKDTWLKRFVNLDKGNDDIDFYNNILNRFPKASDDLLLFFYLREDRVAFLTQCYFDCYTDKFENEYSLQYLCSELADIEKLKNNFINFYFYKRQDVIDNINKYTLHEITLLISELALPDKLKQLLIMFFIKPEYYSEKLIANLILYEKSLDQYYKDNYSNILELNSKIDSNYISDTLNINNKTNCSFQNDRIVFSICLILCNMVRYFICNDLLIFITGINGRDFMTFLNKINSDIQLDRLGKIFSEPNRIKIITMLAENDELYTSEVAKNLSITVTAAYYHLDMMLEAKMLYSRSEGRAVFYRLNETYFNDAVNQIYKLIRKNGENQ